MHSILPKHFGFLLFFLILTSYSRLLAQNAVECEVSIVAFPVAICNGVNTARLTANLIPGNTGPITYNWYRVVPGANPEVVQSTNSNIYEAGQRGTYYVIASSTGCSNSPRESNRVDITVTDPPSDFNIVTNPNASQLCEGTPINFSIQGAEADVEYQWTFGDGSAPKTGTAVTHTYNTQGGGGTEAFTVTVEALRQPGRCITTKTQVLTVLQKPELTMEEKNNFEICLPDSVAPADTTIAAVLTNTTADGIAAYYIDWGTGDGEVRYLSRADLFPLEGPEYTELDNYTIRVRAVGDNGCEAIQEYVFSYNQKPKAGFEVAKPAPDPSPQPTDCLPIIVAMQDTSSGGGLTYRWEVQPATGFTVMPNTGYTMDTLALNFTVAGNYQITLIIENACGADTTEQSVLVGYPQVQLPPDTTICGPGERINYSASSTFFDANFGEINPATIRWTVRGLSNGYEQTYNEQYPNIVFPLAGQYSVSVFAENNCGDTDDLGNPPAQRVTVLPIPGAPTVPALNPVCSGDSVVIRPIGPGPNYNFYESEFDQAPIATGLTFTTPALTQSRSYFVRAVNEQNCEGPGVLVAITVNPPIENNIISVDDPEVCATVGNVLIRGQLPTGGNGSFAYQWEISTSGPTAGFSAAAGNNTGQDYNASALNQRVWFRRVVVSGDCPDISEPVEILIRTAPAPPVTASNVAVCSDSSATLTVTPVAGNSYEWFTVGTGGTPAFVGESYTVSVTQATTYYVQAVGANGCPSPRVPVTVSIVTPVANAGEDVTIIQGRVTELRGSGGVSYQWEPAEGLNDPNVRNPIASPTQTTTYTVTVTTAEGCVATDEVTVTVLPGIKVPNAFTPNRDGVNDIWELENIENYPDLRVEVFNRWGNLIFTSNGYGTPWDGTYRGEDLPVATYYYMIYLNSSERPISGNVTIIR